jgi:hypothetical protein
MQDLVETMKASLKGKLEVAMELFANDKAKAIEYVKSTSTAGWKVWETVLKEMGL